MDILVDTSLIIEYLRVSNREKTLLSTLFDREENFLISVVTHTEVFSGKSVWEESESYKKVKRLIEIFTVLPVDLSVSEEAGFIRAKYGLDIIDALIAATAIKRNLQLATLNKKHFERVEDLQLLQLNSI